MEVDVIDDEANESEDKKAIDLIINIIRYESPEKKLKASEILKRLFNKSSTVTLENKICHRLTINALLENLQDLQKNSKYEDGEFLLKYSNSIINFINSNDDVNPQLLSQLEWIYNQLLDSQYLNIYIRNIWNSLETKSTNCIPIFSLILPSSAFYIEEIILTKIKQICIDKVDVSDVNIKHIVRLSGHLPALFKMITSILNQFVIMTHYDDRVMRFLNYYMKSLFRYCDESGLNVLNLYPRDCCRLVSLLRMPVDICDNQLVDVCGVLWENFINDRVKVLWLLTHFPDWLDVFLEYVKKKS